ncbi:MAG: hypothetical protein GY696_11125 [Gammaproteobacteria bacterium]|nr:hypothetical protein [Gammaproteobacteria bacterium]
MESLNGQFEKSQRRFEYREESEGARRSLCGCSGPASRAAGNLDPWMPSTALRDEKTPVFPLVTAGFGSTDLPDGRQLGKEVLSLPTRLCYHHHSPHVVAERGYGRSSGKTEPIERGN